MRARLFAALLAAAVISLASSARATPITYFFSSGQVTVTATVSGSPVAGPVVIALNGTSVTVDEGTVTLNSLGLSAGSSGTIPISPSYLGFTSLHIDFATLTASGGSLSLVDPGPPAEYNYSVGPVTVAGQFDATNVIPANSLNNAPFGFSNPSASGTIFVDTGVALALDGITLGQIDPDGPGGNPPLVIKGDFDFVGAVPEPGAALSIVLGLAGFAALRRARSEVR
ncbi:MAG TPA: PEP-CTERM sorting domain-containing protein [Myxococcota bacterium]|nr:PEP-CTERM sorting domain-containing protein [Myxococcota bacterium]HVN75287.1 PEP-CTERM sorting domain-containing protein [Thermoanaerobaculaceae bacterium]